MPQPVDLSTVIEDAISDAQLPDDTPETVDDSSSIDTASTETTTESLEASTSDASTETDAEPSTGEVASPAAAQAAQTPEGELGAMDKKLGIPSHTNGRENRIPYSRVKKIVEKAEREATTPLQTKLAELEPKVQDYEARLQNVAQFEDVMLNKPQQFMQMLASIPAYQGFFKAIEDLQAQVQGRAQQASQQEQVVDDDPMPQPGEDGLYDMEGLKKLLDWQARQVEARTLQQVESKYKPIRQEWEAQQHLNKLIPQVEQQIAEARTWPLFNESESEIIKFLNENPQARLEDAYRVVVFPKLQANRDKIRAQVLEEVKRAPISTSAPTRSTKPAPAAPKDGPRDLEDVIREQVSTLNGR